MCYNVLMTLLKVLEDISSDYCVSLYTPVYNRITSRNDNESKLNKLKHNIRDRLERFEMTEGQIKDILDPLEKFIEFNKTFNYPINSLIIFFSNRGLFSKTYQKELALSEIFVTNNFEIEKFNEFESFNSDCFILKLFQDEVQFYQSSADGLTVINLPGLSKTFKDLSEDVELVQSLQSHSTSAATMMIHGNNDEDNYLQNRLSKYVKHIELEVSNYLSKLDLKPPLVLASSQAIAGIYREYNTYKNLFENLISVNQKHSSIEDLKIKVEANLEASGKQ